MTVIIDASAAIELMLKRKSAKAIAAIISRADWVIAPDLFVSEVTNVFWKYHEFEDLPIDICERYLDDTLLLVDDYISCYDLYKEAFALSCQVNHSVYDAMYLVLTRRQAGLLVTMDKQLERTAIKNSIKVYDLIGE